MHASNVAVCYLTECALTTVALLLNRQGTTAGELRRHIDIAQYGMDYLVKEGVNAGDISHLPRVAFLLNSTRQTPNNVDNSSVHNWVKSLKTVLPK